MATGLKLFYVYELLFPSGKRYFGKTKNVAQRFKKHARALNKSPLANAFRKYGVGCVEVRVVYKNCSEKCCFDAEKRFIKKHNTRVPNGYNLTDGGEGFTGGRHSPATRKRMGDLSRGRKTSDATREKQRQSALGRKMSRAARAKISAAKRGSKHSMSTIQKMRAAHLGKTLSREHRLKIGDANRGRFHSRETRLKIGKLALGYRHTAAAKIKISAAGKARWARQRAQFIKGAAHA